MDRPVRRSRQRIPESGLIGLLPQEEAAINRALHESLLQEKKSPSKRKLPTSTPTTKPHSSGDNDRTHTTGTSAVGDNESGEGSSTTRSRRRLHSPRSSSQSLDSSSESSPSRGSRGAGAGCSGSTFRATSSSSVSSPRSVEGSLKLILSTSSWSTSSSSSWSPTPQPVAGSTAEKASQKRNPVTTQLQSKLKTVKGTGTNVKGKRGRPRKYPANGSSSKCAPKSGKIKGSTKVSKTGKLPPKTYTKAALQLHGASLSNKKKKQLKSRPKLSKPKNEHGPSGTERSSELDVPPLSPEAALVLHDHCYIGGVNHDREDNTTDAKCSIRSSPYTAQRKFPQNQVPTCTPTRPPVDEVESVSGPKEVPKTEDFITFLCLRGSDSIPKDLEKFAFPWTHFQQKKSKNEISTKRKALSFTTMKGVKSKSRNVAKKLGYSTSNSIPALSSH